MEVSSCDNALDDFKQGFSGIVEVFEGWSSVDGANK